MTSSLRALINLIELSDFNVEVNSNSSNRMNSQGESFENYIQSLFCEGKKFEDVFSYKGDANHPPDFILKNSDAIEVKKHESKQSGTSVPKSDIALNSSHPRSHLYSDDEKITDSCVKCEANWIKKDMLYIIGSVVKGTNNIEYLWFVYGDCFAADREYYKSIEVDINNHLKNLIDKGLELESESNELGKIKEIDPLKITDLRIRGMYQLKNPYKLFSDIINDEDSNLIEIKENEKAIEIIKLASWTKESHIKKKSIQDNIKKINDELIDIKRKEKSKNKVFFLVSRNKYDTFPKNETKKICSLVNNNLSIQDVMLKDPTTLKPLPAVLIKYISR